MQASHAALRGAEHAAGEQLQLHDPNPNPNPSPNPNPNPNPTPTPNQVNPGLKPGGWSETRFVDCKLADVWGTFLPMYNTGGFTDAKLRVRFDGADAVQDQV